MQTHQDSAILRRIAHATLGWIRSAGSISLGAWKNFVHIVRNGTMHPNTPKQDRLKYDETRND